MLLNVILKSILVYFIVLILLKFMGKREIGQVSLFDFAIILIISDVLVFSIEEKTNNFWHYFICGLLLTIIQRFISFLLLKSRKIRVKFDGEESIIIYDGKLNVEEMKKQRYNMDDLILQLRLSNVSSLKEVKYLILENNGRISVFKYEDQPKNPFPLIVSGKIEYKNFFISPPPFWVYYSTFFGVFFNIKMLFAKAKSYLTSSLFTITYYFQKI